MVRLNSGLPEFSNIIVQVGYSRLGWTRPGISRFRARRSRVAPERLSTLAAAPRQVRIWVSALRIARRIALCSIARFRRALCRDPGARRVQAGVLMHSPDPPVVTD